MRKYKLNVIFENDDCIVTYFNAYNLEEIIEHYKGYKLEYYNGETTTTYAIEIKDNKNNDLMTYYYWGVIENEK